MFLSGNPDEPNCDWQSGLYDPAYFPDTGYTKIGSDASAIVGYVRQYESQLVIKEGRNQEATQYLRTFLLDDNGTAAYPLQQGAQGAGGLAPRSFASLGDTPLFLSSDGVMGVFGTAAIRISIIRRMSRAVDPRLTSENGLADACAVVWKDKYYLAVDASAMWPTAEYHGRMVRPNGITGIPSRRSALWCSTGGLWFGTTDGRICRVSDKDERDAYLDDGQAIDAWWCTPDCRWAPGDGRKMCAK